MSGLYASYKGAMLGAAGTGLPVDLDTDTIKIALVNITTDYTVDLANHDYLNDVTRYTGTTDQTLSGVTVAGGVFNATSPVTFSSVAISGGKTVGALVIYKDNAGVAANSPLICYIDGFTAVTPNGGNIVITFDSGANKIFKVA